MIPFYILSSSNYTSLHMRLPLFKEMLQIIRCRAFEFLSSTLLRFEFEFLSKQLSVLRIDNSRMVLDLVNTGGILENCDAFNSQLLAKRRMR